LSSTNSSFNQQPFKKNDALQILRAVAALLVVHRHCVEVVRLHQEKPPANSYALDKFGACGVDIFFVISGFILATVVLRTDPQTPGLALDFLTRRVLRIFPIYWIVSIFFLVLAATHNLLTPEGALNSYLLLPSGYPLKAPLLIFGWTLMFEMFFYYLITFNLLFGKRVAVLRTITSILLLTGIGAFTGFQKTILILIANPMNMEFVLGCLIALAYARFGTRPRMGTAFLISGCLALATTVWLGYGRIDDAAFVLNGSESWARVLRWGIPAAAVTAGVVFRRGDIRSTVARFFARLGDASYSIYLTSVGTLFLANRFYRPFAGLPPVLNVSLLIFLVTSVGVVTYARIERPITRLLSGKYETARGRGMLLLLNR
jgi:exopolysaccharide production protein ExoZ